MELNGVVLVEGTSDCRAVETLARRRGRDLQAEGVAITKDSILIISDEATSKPAAVTLYRWRSSEAGESNK